MPNIYKINDIFQSIQGEGFHTGTPVIFIRFSGCNLNCSFCDTNHQEGRKYTLKTLIQEIKKYPQKIVVLTGGEPMLQVDDELVNNLHRIEKKIHVETNGTIRINQDIDWITVSPKKEALEQKYGNELKVIYIGQSISHYLDYDFDNYYLQPIDKSGKMNIKQTIKQVLKEKLWKVSIQTQKLIGIK